MGKLIIKDLQLTGVKGASKLSTDENGNVVAGEDVGGVVDTSDEALAAQLIAQDDLFRRGVLKKVSVFITNRDMGSSFIDGSITSFKLSGSFYVGTKEYSSELFTTHYGIYNAADSPFTSLFLNDILIGKGEELRHSLKMNFETYKGESIKLDVFFLSPLYPSNIKPNTSRSPVYKTISRIPIISTDIIEGAMRMIPLAKMPSNVIEGFVNPYGYNRDKVPLIEEEEVINLPLTIEYSGYGEGDFKPIIDKIVFVKDSPNTGRGMPIGIIAVGEIARPKEGEIYIKTPPYKFNEVHVILRRSENREVLAAGLRLTINGGDASISRYEEFTIHKEKYYSMPTGLSYTIEKAHYANG